MKITPPDPHLAAIAASVARQAYPYMLERDCHDVANNLVGSFANLEAFGERVDHDACIARRLGQMLRDFPDFYCGDVAVCARLMGAEYRRQRDLAAREVA